LVLPFITAFVVRWAFAFENLPGADDVFRAALAVAVVLWLMNLIVCEMSLVREARRLDGRGIDGSSRAVLHGLAREIRIGVYVGPALARLARRA
jgi:hypothetical protein